MLYVCHWRMSHSFFVKSKYKVHYVVTMMCTNSHLFFFFLKSIMNCMNTYSPYSKHVCISTYMQTHIYVDIQKHTFPRFWDCITFCEKPHTMTSACGKPNNPAPLPEPSRLIRVWMNPTTLPFSSRLLSCLLQNQSEAAAHISNDKRGDSERKLKRL